MASATELRLIARYFGSALARAANAAAAAPKASASGGLATGVEQLGLIPIAQPLIKPMQVASMFEAATASHTGPAAALMTKAAAQGASSRAVQL